MKRSIVFLLVLFTCCATSRIDINKSEVKQVRSIAIIPFASTVKLEREIPVQAAEYFRKAFTMCGISVIEQSRVDELLKKTESGSQVIAGDRTVDAGRTLGVDAILTGKITLHEEENRIVSNHWYGMIVTGSMNDRHDRTQWNTYLKFRITVELVRVSDGSVIMKMTNRSTETEKDNELPCCMDINAYRSYVLKKMSSELVAEITGKD